MYHVSQQEQNLTSITKNEWNLQILSLFWSNTQTMLIEIQGKCFVLNFDYIIEIFRGKMYFLCFLSLFNLKHYKTVLVHQLLWKIPILVTYSLYLVTGFVSRWHRWSEKREIISLSRRIITNLSHRDLLQDTNRSWKQTLSPICGRN